MESVDSRNSQLLKGLVVGPQGFEPWTNGLQLTTLNVYIFKRFPNSRRSKKDLF
jgi:hypothetical protein